MRESQKRKGKQYNNTMKFFKKAENLYTGTRNRHTIMNKKSTERTTNHCAGRKGDLKA